jgi:hypothetical protein
MQNRFFATSLGFELGSTFDAFLGLNSPISQMAAGDSAQDASVVRTGLERTCE